jgi:hypothetical protein
MMRPINQVCRHQIRILPLYAEAPSALEQVARAAKLLLPLLYLALAVQVVWEFAVPLAALHTWRLALTGSCAEVRRLFSARLFAPSVLACSAVWAEGVTRARYGGDLPRYQRVTLKILGLSLSVWLSFCFSTSVMYLIIIFMLCWCDSTFLP